MTELIDTFMNALAIGAGATAGVIATSVVVTVFAAIMFVIVVFVLEHW